MGQKVNPIGLRVGVIRGWESKWYTAKTNVPALIKEDYLIREFLFKTFKSGQVSKVEIERSRANKKDRIKITLHTAKPGVVIGREGKTKDEAKKQLEKITKKDVMINVVEIKSPERVALLVAKFIAEQLENRASFRRAQKLALQRALKAGALGCKTMVSGRLGGAEMARSEGYSEGRVPLQTLRADIDYAIAEASTIYGKLGVKVWIFNGEVLPGQMIKPNVRDASERRQNDKGPQNKKPGYRPSNRPSNQSAKGGN